MEGRVAIEYFDESDAAQVSSKAHSDLGILFSCALTAKLAALNGREIARFQDFKLSRLQLGLQKHSSLPNACKAALKARAAVCEGRIFSPHVSVICEGYHYLVSLIPIRANVQVDPQILDLCQCGRRRTPLSNLSDPSWG